MGLILVIFGESGSDFGHFWPILRGFGRILAILGEFLGAQAWFRVWIRGTLGLFGTAGSGFWPFWACFAGFGPIWVWIWRILGLFGGFRPGFGPFWASLEVLGLDSGHLGGSWPGFGPISEHSRVDFGHLIFRRVLA